MSATVPTNEDHKYNVSVQLTVINCGVCGGTYAINERHRQLCSEEGKSWHCPYCKTGWGYSTSEIHTLKSELARAKKEKEWAEQEAMNAENRRRAEKGAKTRLKNRIAKGVCPCCTRSFVNLKRHMDNKHPDYSEVKNA